MSLGAIIPISVVGVLTYSIAGHVALAYAALLPAGSFVGARAGASLLARADDRWLKIAFGSLLVVAAILMVTSA